MTEQHAAMQDRI